MGPGALFGGETCLFLLQQIWTTLSIHTSEHQQLLLWPQVLTERTKLALTNHFSEILATDNRRKVLTFILTVMKKNLTPLFILAVNWYLNHHKDRLGEAESK